MRLEGNKSLTESSRTPEFNLRAITIRRQKGRYLWIMMLIIAACFSAKSQAQQYYLVDCTGTNPSDFPSINAALAAGPGPNSVILVTGTCTENVYITSAFNLNIGAWYGQTANLVGGISVTDSESVYFYGLNVSNPTGSGFNITSSRAVTLDSCTSNGNLGHGWSARRLLYQFE